MSHAYTQGIIYGLSGGDFLDGFSSGGISSLVSSVVGLGGTALKIDGSKTVGTLFFGTISGGFGSMLTGGNFWYGSATGLIVSGLNHTMHSMEKNLTLKQEMKNAGIDPTAVPEFSKTSIVELLTKVKTLQDLWEMSDYQTFTLDDSEVDSRKGYKRIGGTIPNVTQNIQSGVFTVKGVKSLTLYKGAFSNYYGLGLTIGHELNHAIHIINGNFQGWLNKYKDENKAQNVSEIHAYNWNISVGDLEGHSKMKIYK